MFDIIICTYNNHKVLNKAIQKVLAQESYDRLTDKFIIVNNNSTDNTEDIIASYVKRDSKIVSVFEPRQGLSNARLSGVNHSQSDWIIFIDDDNLLGDNWLTGACQYIQSHKDVGAFNGAVVPLTEKNTTDREKINLELMYKGLACTHLYERDIDHQQSNHPAGRPFGAGLVIKAIILRSLAGNGWLKSAGRRGTNIISGEDTEMCNYVEKLGFKLGYCANMKLFHFIPRQRLKLDYLEKLSFSFGYVNAKSRVKLILMFFYYSILKFKLCVIYMITDKSNYKKIASEKIQIKFLDGKMSYINSTLRGKK